MTGNPFPDSRPLTPEDLADCEPVPPPECYASFSVTPLYVSYDGIHFVELPAEQD